MIVVDTSVLSGALGRKRVRDDSTEGKAVAQFKKLIRSKAELGIPGIVYQEVLSRIPDEAVVEKLRIRLQGLTFLAAEQGDHDCAADVANACMRAGIESGAVDYLIAAIAIRYGAKLLTADPDFSHIARCTSLELWPIR